MNEVVSRKLNVVLHLNQQTIVDCPARFKVVKAGKRFGKSWVAVYMILRWAGRTPGGLFWYIAPTYGNAKDIAWNVIKFMLPRDTVKRYLESELTVELQNGARIVLKGADNEESLRGTALDGVVLDERAYQDEYLWGAIIRGQLANSLGPAFFISSPSKKGRNHYSSFYDEAKKKMEAGDPEWAAFYFTIYDNPTLSRTEIEAVKEGCSDSTWELEYMAQESAHSGILFSEFTFDKNVAEYRGDKILNNYRSVDWGIGHPTVCLFASLDLEQKTLYVTDEYVHADNVIRENCSVIKAKSGDKPIEWTVIDPSMARRDKNNRNLREMDEFSRWGVTCVPGDNRDRGYDITKMFLKYGMLKISPRCKNLINELRSLQWGDTTGDDTTDALRYLCVRINDLVYGMNIYDHDKVASFKKDENPNVMNFNDPALFPQKKKSEEKNWVLDELEVA